VKGVIPLPTEKTRSNHMEPIAEGFAQEGKTIESLSPQQKMPRRRGRPRKNKKVVEARFPEIPLARSKAEELLMHAIWIDLVGGSSCKDRSRTRKEDRFNRGDKRPWGNPYFGDSSPNRLVSPSSAVQEPWLQRRFIQEKILTQTQQSLCTTPRRFCARLERKHRTRYTTWTKACPFPKTAHKALTTLNLMHSSSKLYSGLSQKLVWTRLFSTRRNSKP
jgi:hypothetical protein